MVVGRQGGKERTHANPDPKNVRETILHLGPQDPPGHTHLAGAIEKLFKISSLLYLCIVHFSLNASLGKGAQ